MSERTIGEVMLQRLRAEAAERSTGVCVDCLGPVPLAGGVPGGDCECGSGYWLPPDATVAQLLEARRWACDDNDPLSTVYAWPTPEGT